MNVCPNHVAGPASDKPAASSAATSTHHVRASVASVASHVRPNGTLHTWPRSVFLTRTTYGSTVVNAVVSVVRHRFPTGALIVITTTLLASHVDSYAVSTIAWSSDGSPSSSLAKSLRT